MIKLKQAKVKRRICWYDGSDPESKYNICMSCKQNNSARSLTSKPEDSEGTYFECDRGCNCFSYCSKRCMRQDHRHKHICRKIRSLRRDIFLLEQNVDIMLILQTPSLVGQFSRRDTPAAFSYLCTRIKLANILLHIAQNYSIARIWTEVNSILQENLRLCHLHVHTPPIKSWCHIFSTSLLHCGRIDDSLYFSSYILRRTRSMHTNYASFKGRVNPDTLHAESTEGQWIYPRNISISDDYRSGDLYLVFIIYIGKLKKAIVFTLIRQAIVSFKETNFGQQIDALQGPLGMVLEYLVPIPLLKITTYEDFLESCNALHGDIMAMTEIIRKRNQYLIKGMSRHRNMENQSDERSSHCHWKNAGHPQNSENFAYDCLKKCEYSLRTTPDLDLWLKYCCEGES